MNKVPLKYSEARTKAMAWCAYQERSPRQLRDKLYEYGLPTEEVDDLIEELEEENFLNEWRFVESYVGGKFRVKGWGRLKIKQGLRPHQVDETLVSKALKQLPEQAYYLKLLTLLEKKNNLITETDNRQRKAKLLRFAAGRGFEQELIWKALTELGI